MSGVSNIMDIAWSGLFTRQKALEITSHNIANADTPGYHRQEAIFQTSTPVSSSIGPMGTGVDIAEVRRFKNDFLGLQLRDETSSLEYWNTMKDTLDQMESIFKEPTENGVSITLMEFWNSWQELASNPEESYARLGVREAGRWLGQHMNLVADSLENLRSNQDEAAVSVVRQINNFANRIAEVNADISAAMKVGNQPNDQFDRRDQLLMELAELVNINVAEDKGNGTVSVYISGDNLLTDTTVREIFIDEDSSGDSTISRFYWDRGKREVEVTGGLLKGFLESRDVAVQPVIDRLDEMAAGIIKSVNEVHEGGLSLDGTTGNSFFEPYAASDGSNRGAARNLKLAQIIENNLDKIAAAGLGGTLPGDNTNAMAIADIRNGKVMQNGQLTINDYYSETIAEVGFATRRAETRQENHGLARDQYRNMQESATGVSLDEEMTQLIRFQHGYQASARLVKMADEVLATLVNLGR
ncbi:flagellar hook-associated protein FlgK [candidate division KSB1 bacterium]